MGPRGRAKVESKEDTQGGGQVLVLSSLFTAARTEGCVNEEVKREQVLLAPCARSCASGELPHLADSWNRES